MPTLLLSLDPAPLICCAGPLRGAVVRRRGKLQDRVGARCGLFGGMLRNARGDGWIGKNPCQPSRHRRGGACGCRRTFLKGVGGYPACLLATYQGKPLAAASSSSCPFWELLIGTGASESRSLVEDPRWAQRSRGFFVFVDPPLLAFVSFVLSLFFFRACMCCFFFLLLCNTNGDRYCGGGRESRV